MANKEIVPGLYRALITRAYPTRVGQKRTPCVIFELELESGRTIEGQLWLTDATADRTCETLLALGWSGVEIGTIGADLKGRHCRATIELETVRRKDGTESMDANGIPVTRAVVRWINADRIPAAPLDMVGLEELDRMISGPLQRAHAKATKPPAANGPSPREAGQDDDIPF